MANFIGTADYFQEERAFNRRLNMLLGLMMGFGAFCFIIGTATGFAQGRQSRWSYVLAFIVLVESVIAVKLIDKRIDNHLRLAKMDEHGASGERETLPFLQKLPDFYNIGCDLAFADSYGISFRSVWVGRTEIMRR